MNTITKKWSSQRFRNFQIGLLVAIGIVIMAFNWTTTPTTYNYKTNVDNLPPDVQMVRTVHEPNITKVPPPKIIPIKLDKVLVEDIEYSNEPKVEYVKDAIVTDIVDLITNGSASEPFIPPAPPVIVSVDEQEDESMIIHVRVERMPVFGDCGQSKKEDVRKECSDRSMLTYVYNNIVYPPMAIENRIEGKVIVQFVIEKDGSIGDITIPRVIGAGCGAEVKRVIQSMPDWIPGQQGIHKVRVKYTLPVKFSLE